MTSFLTDSSKWNAVRTKAAEADGQFVCCVKTTKIYCRPICKARLARRANVEFFDTGSESVAAGYRACKRCRPELENFVPQADQAIERIRKSLEIFKKATGFTPREYVAASRRGFVAVTPGAMSVPELSTGTTGSPRSWTEDGNAKDKGLLEMEDLFSFDDFTVPAMQSMTKLSATVIDDGKNMESSAHYGRYH
ncbi:Bifunctional transcriptional activator/DNA repair enzyme Ada [Cercospora zeina]